MEYVEFIVNPNKTMDLIIDGVEMKNVLEFSITKNGGGPVELTLRAVVKKGGRVEGQAGI